MGKFINFSIFPPPVLAIVKVGSERREQAKKPTHRVISEVEGNYHYTYLLDAQGNKFLLSKIFLEHLNHLSPQVHSPSDFEKIMRQVRAATAEQPPVT